MYEFNIKLEMEFDEALAALQQALQSEKLGIVSEIDVQAIMKKKLDKEGVMRAMRAHRHYEKPSERRRRKAARSRLRSAS